MSADHMLYPMDFSSQQEEWLDFDSLFDLPSGYLDSHPTSVESISPRDSDQMFPDTEFLNWDSDPTMSSQIMFPDFVGYQAPAEALGHPALGSFQAFINPNDVLQSVPPPSQDQFLGFGFDGAWLPDAQNFDAPSYSSLRYMVESQAALDTRCFSKKEKRREAAIALHLQRLQNAALPELDTPLQSNGFSSPNWTDFSLDIAPLDRSTTAATSPVSDSTQKSSSPAFGSDSGAGGMQLVLDLNMNTTTKVPRKQKPRSKAQRENYIKARKYGVCEKHRKQHKRCNCLEKAAATHLTVNGRSCAGLNPAGLRNNHERVLVNTSLPRSVQSPTMSTSTGQPSPLVRQPIRTSKPALSPSLPLQTFVPEGCAQRATPQIPQSLPTSNYGSLPSVALYRDKKSEKQQHNTGLGEERSRQVIRQSVESGSLCVSRGNLNVQRQIPLTEKASAIARKTAVGLFSFWQGSTTCSSWAGFFLGRLVVFSSGIYMRSRKGMGLF